MTIPKIVTSILLFYQVLIVKTNTAMGRHYILGDNSVHLSLRAFPQDRPTGEAWCEHVKIKIKHWMGQQVLVFCAVHTLSKNVLLTRFRNDAG